MGLAHTFMYSVPGGSPLVLISKFSSLLCTNVVRSALSYGTSTSTSKVSIMRSKEKKEEKKKEKEYESEYTFLI